MKICRRRVLSRLFDPIARIVRNQCANEQKGEHAMRWNKEVALVDVAGFPLGVELLKLELEELHESCHVLRSLNKAQVLGFEDAD